MHSALQREKLTAANRTVLSSQLAFHAMQRRRFLENSALASLPLLSSLALLPGCAVYERNIHSDDRPSADAPAGRFRGVRQPDTGIQVYLGIPFMKNPYEPVRRFLAPQPMERIADTLDCVKHGALPLQPGPNFPSWFGCLGAVPFAVHKTMSDLTERILLPTAAFWLRSPIA